MLSSTIKFWKYYTSQQLTSGNLDTKLHNALHKQSSTDFTQQEKPTCAAFRTVGMSNCSLSSFGRTEATLTQASTASSRTESCSSPANSLNRGSRSHLTCSSSMHLANSWRTEERVNVIGQQLQKKNTQTWTLLPEPIIPKAIKEYLKYSNYYKPFTYSSLYNA